jgi:DNA polymerase-3 subunit gamma/tau
MGHGALGRLWQLLVKGHDEVLRATNAMDTLDMVLLRVIHAASMPDPAELVRLIREGGFAAPAAAQVPGAPVADSAPTANDNGAARADLGIEDLYNMLDSAGRHGLAVRLHDYVAPVQVAVGVLHFEAGAQADDALARELADAMLAISGSRWEVRAVAESGAPTMKALRDAAAAADTAALMDNPLVQAARAAFPGAKLVND